MEKKLKVSEVAAVLGITPKTVYRMIEREELRTCQETVKNRKITFVLLTDQEKTEFLKDSSHDTDNDGNCEDTLTAQYTVNDSKNIDIMDKMHRFYIEVTDRHNDSLRQYNDNLKDYIDRVIESEKQVRLLEDSETRKESEYLKQISELKAELAKERAERESEKNKRLFGLFKI